MLLYTVYAIYNSLRDKIYVGFTHNLEQRLLRHNNQLPNKSSSFTAKQNGRWELVYTENFDTKREAQIREKALKSFRGREFVRKIVAEKYFRP